jgi:hypothetical protein
MDSDSTTSAPCHDRPYTDAPPATLIPSAAWQNDGPPSRQWVCGSCPLRSPYRGRNELSVGPGPAPTVRQSLRRAAVDWRPLTTRIRGSVTLAIRVSDFRTNLASAVGFVQRGGVRIVLLRGRCPVAAIVPVADFWFLFQVEQELRRLGWFTNRRAPQPEAIAQAIVALQPQGTGSDAGRIGRRPLMRETAPSVTFDKSEPLARQLRAWRWPREWGR